MSPIVIAGGGIAGAAVAAGLAQAGLDVTVFERETGPTDKICGEFLSTEAQDYLIKLGLHPAGLGGHLISELALLRGTDQIQTTLPFTGIGISRRTLDEAMLAHAARCGAKVLRGHKVTFVSTEGGLAIDVSGLGQVRPESLFLATGKHELRGLTRGTSSRNDLVGFKMYFRLTSAAETMLAGKIALILFRHGYAGFQLVEGQKANLCLLADRSFLQSAGGDWPGLLSELKAQNAYLRQLLAGATALLEKPLTIYRVPYGYVHRAKPSNSGQIYRLGDQAAVIPSFTGDGMAIALHSAALAVTCFLAGDPASTYHRKLSRDISGQIKRAGQLYALSRNSITQPAFFGIAKLWPASLRFAASLTRVPVRARV
jgi:flavin-dependent dehydrogenase